MSQRDGLQPTQRYETDKSVRLGRTDVQVTQMGIGTVPMSGLFATRSHEDGIALMQAGWDAGVRFYDMAPLYGHGFAERVVGDFLRTKPRDEYTLATKVGRLLKTSGASDREDRTVVYEGKSVFPDAGLERPFFDFSYDGTMRSIEASQKRSGIERFDILHIHDPEDFMDEATEGAYRALDELRDSGQVGAIGVGSNNWDCHLEMSHRGDFDCFLVAGRYTLLDQTALPELMPVCEEKGIAVIAAGVYNSGILSHPDPGSIAGVSRDPADMGTWKDSVTFNYRPAEADIIAKAAAIKAVCDRYDVPLAAAAEQFPMHHPAVPTVLIGALEPEHVRANDENLRFAIPTDLWAELKSEGLLPEEAPTE